MSKIEGATCKIVIEREDGRKERGTGFFINSKQVLTCNHVLSDDQLKIEVSKIGPFDNGITLTAQVIDQCLSCDYALLEVIDDFQSEDILDVCDSTIVEDETFTIFGYPNTEEGQQIGKGLSGTISRIVIDNTISIHDIILSITDYSRSELYNAFSGSPIVNDYGQVIGILKYQDEQHLAGVSIKKALSFLKNNNIQVRQDQHNSFEAYNDVFNLYPEDIKTDCEARAINAIESKKPIDIINSLKGNLFYPTQNKQVSDIITQLKKEKDVNDSLWKGWIKLLTYVEIIKGDSSNVNHIQFNLTEIDVKTLYGDNISTNYKIDIPLKLSFYFTVGKSYFQIARSFLPIKTNQKENTCSIFNSNDENYFLQKFTSVNKKKIIPNISGDIGSGFKVEEKINFGVLSLQDLSSEIVNSVTLEEATINIEKLFIDAIK